MANKNLKLHSVNRSKKIRRGDMVEVNTGAYKGTRGKVIAVSGNQILVEGVNQVIKHVKPNPQRNEKGGRLKIEKPVHVSNLRIVGTDGNAGRVGFKFDENGNKVRFIKKTGELVS